MFATAPQPSAINAKALLWTIGIHLLLLLLFFLFQYSIPVIKEDIGNGLEVNLGTSDNGSGTGQPQRKDAPSAYSATVVYKNVAKKTDLPKDMLRTDDPSATAINNPEKTKTIPKPDAGNEKNKLLAPVPRYVYQGSNGKGGNDAQQNVNGTSEGNTTGPGDRGVTGGTPGATAYTGAPGTGGIGHTLTGRSITPARFEAEFHEGGKVVIHVTVDRDGNIVSKLVKSTSSQELTRLALDKLNKAKFSKSTGSEPQQFGDVTIVFKTH